MPARGQLLRIEAQRCRADAVTHARRRRTVREDVPEVRVAYVADDLGAPHAVARSDLLPNVGGIERPEVARPSASRIEFRVRLEERRAAAHARVDAVLVMVGIFAGARRFGG